MTLSVPFPPYHYSFSPFPCPSLPRSSLSNPFRRPGERRKLPQVDSRRSPVRKRIYYYTLFCAIRQPSITKNVVSLKGLRLDGDNSCELVLVDASYLLSPFSACSSTQCSLEVGARTSAATNRNLSDSRITDGEPEPTDRAGRSSRECSAFFSATTRPLLAADTDSLVYSIACRSAWCERAKLVRFSAAFD